MTIVVKVPTTQIVRVPATSNPTVRLAGSGTGPPGPPGPEGPRGYDADTAFRHVHQQLVPAAVWTIVHGLAGKPAVTIVDSAGVEHEGSVTYPDDNTVTVTFSAPFGGEAHLS